jgi:hypothetical protein
MSLLFRIFRVLFSSLVLMFSSIPLSHALVNGGVTSGSIASSTSEDSYTFSANAGENVMLRVADISDNAFDPRVQLYDPDGALVGGDTGLNVAAIGPTLPASGTYTVIVSDPNLPADTTGNYNLYFAHMPGANELGSLSNAELRSDAIDLGDIDTYTFSGNAGEHVVIRVADTSGGPASSAL